QHTQSVCHFYQ
ncbi:hypothetical protein D039_0807B, partial [Vibrio parahaemolyticus EKP-028]